MNTWICYEAFRQGREPVGGFLFVGQVAPSPGWECRHLEKAEHKWVQTECFSGLYSQHAGEGSRESQPN